MEEWSEKSKVINQKVIHHPWFLNASEILCYMDHRMEVSTKMMILEAFRMGKKVAIPKVHQDTMEFYYIDDIHDVKEGYFGIREPKNHFAANGEHALMIMPGVAFDRKCNRIGYGKGFYDKYVTGKSIQRIIALAFEYQIVESVPTQEHDVRPELIITEEREYE